jgi:branched-chain amino acid aminotransferase
VSQPKTFGDTPRAPGPAPHPDIVWLNGGLMPAETVRIDPTDRGFTLGDGIFETIRADGGAPLHWDRHFARLRLGARMLGLPIPATEAQLAEALVSVLAANNLAGAALRLTLTRGPAPRGVLPPRQPHPTLLITAGPLPGREVPARLMIADRVRRNEFSPLCGIKSLNYGDNILARQLAAQAGFDDALLLNTEGILAEATAANVFLYIGDRWRTPALRHGALPGIARGLLMETGKAVEAPITPTDIARAEAALLVNSLSRRPVSEIAGRLLRLDLSAEFARG